MYLQRFSVDPRFPDRFEVDYMGAAQYEGGAFQVGLNKLLYLILNGSLVGKPIRFIELRKGYQGIRKPMPPIRAYVFTNKEVIDSRGDEWSIPVICEDFLTDNERVRAWMQVDRMQGRSGRFFHPLLIVRADPQDIKLGNEMLEHFVKHLTSEQKEKIKQDHPYDPTKADPMNYWIHNG